MEETNVYDLYCWCCESLSGIKTKVCGGSTIRIIKSEKCHLTTSDEYLTQTTYVKEHHNEQERDFKPLRMHCNICKNHLGVVIISDGKLKPSFHQAAVYFMNKEGERMSVNKWKHLYSREHNVVPYEILGSKGRTPKDPKFFILDHKAWEHVNEVDLRMFRDIPGDEGYGAKEYKWNLSKNGPYYEVEGLTIKSPRIQRIKDLETSKNLNLDSLVAPKSKLYVPPRNGPKPVPKKFLSTVRSANFA